MSQLYNEMIEWRHYLHTHPETAFQEKNTAAFVAEKLRGWGYEVETGIGGTGVVGKMHCGTGRKTVALLADMDANPITELGNPCYKSVNNGSMHACGHDGHVTQLLGAAKLLSERKNFNGTLLVVFQPAEEPGRGALAMISDGFLEKYPIDEFYGLHNSPSLPAGSVHTRPGAIMGSEDDFIIEIHGKGAHASSPHLSKDPLVTSAQVILGLQTIVSRNADPLDNIVISCTEMFTDGAVNAIPSNVTIKGDTRSFKPENQEMMETRMRNVVRGICEAAGLGWEFTYTHEFSPTVNTPACSEAVAKAASEIIGAEKVNSNCTPWMGAEDFGRFLQHVPGAFFFLGSAVKPQLNENIPLHNAEYDYNDSILETGAEVFAEIIRERLV